MRFLSAIFLLFILTSSAFAATTASFLTQRQQWWQHRYERSQKELQTVANDKTRKLLEYEMTMASQRASLIGQMLTSDISGMEIAVQRETVSKELRGLTHAMLTLSLLEQAGSSPSLKEYTSHYLQALKEKTAADGMSSALASEYSRDYLQLSYIHALESISGSVHNTIHDDVIDSVMTKLKGQDTVDIATLNTLAVNEMTALDPGAHLHSAALKAPLAPTDFGLKQYAHKSPFTSLAIEYGFPDTAPQHASLHAYGKSLFNNLRQNHDESGSITEDTRGIYNKADTLRVATTAQLDGSESSSLAATVSTLQSMRKETDNTMAKEYLSETEKFLTHANTLIAHWRRMQKERYAGLLLFHNQAVQQIKTWSEQSLLLAHVSNDALERRYVHALQQFAPLIQSGVLARSLTAGDIAGLTERDIYEMRQKAEEHHRKISDFPASLTDYRENYQRESAQISERKKDSMEVRIRRTVEFDAMGLLMILERTNEYAGSIETNAPIFEEYAHTYEDLYEKSGRGLSAEEAAKLKESHSLLPFIQEWDTQDITSRVAARRWITKHAMQTIAEMISLRDRYARQGVHLEFVPSRAELLKMQENLPKETVASLGTWNLYETEFTRQDQKAAAILLQRHRRALWTKETSPTTMIQSDSMPFVLHLDPYWEKTELDSSDHRVGILKKFRLSGNTATIAVARLNPPSSQDSAAITLMKGEGAQPIRRGTVTADTTVFEWTMYRGKNGRVIESYETVSNGKVWCIITSVDRTHYPYLKDRMQHILPR